MKFNKWQYCFKIRNFEIRTILECTAIICTLPVAVESCKRKIEKYLCHYKEVVYSDDYVVYLG